MNKKAFTFMIALLLAICTGATGFYAGKAAGQGGQQEELQEEPQGELQEEPQGGQQGALERLQQLNRAGIENVIIEKEPMDAPELYMDPDVKDFYQFTLDSFRVENYHFHKLGKTIEVAI